MRRISALLTILFLVFLLAGAAFAAGKAAGKPVEKQAADKPAEKPKIPGIGDPAPNFELPGLDGKVVSFSKDIKGKKPLAIIVFMTTACSACQSEIAAINELMGRYGSKVTMYSVAVDIRGAANVKPYSEMYNYKTTYLLDPKFTVPRLFGFNYTPSVVMIDKSGKVVFMKGGYAPGDEEILQEKIVAVLK